MKLRLFATTLAMALVALLINWLTTLTISLGASDLHKRDSADLLAGLIDDAIMRKGWEYLNSQNDPVHLWDGQILTGHDLAQFMITNRIPILWGSDDICEGKSCSRLVCFSNGFCTFDHGLPEVGPIYLNHRLRDRQPNLIPQIASDLAHEIFHRMQPFGPVKPTQFEEYWAFRIETQIARNEWPTFHGYDPTDARQLQKWIMNHHLAGYTKLAPYPEGMSHLTSFTGAQYRILGDQSKGLSLSPK